MERQKFNLHTHTARCGHADGTDEEYIRCAVEAGFRALGFSEHIQYRQDNGKYGRIDYEDFPQYFCDIRRLAEKFKGCITVYCGLEASYIPEAMDDVLQLAKDCDYLLLGQHKGGINHKKYCLHCDDEEVLDYAADIEHALQTGIFSVVAHPDYFMVARDSWSRQCAEAAERICLSAKKYHVPLELNVKGSYGTKIQIDGKYCVRYPFRKFWEIAADIGNEVLYGWDAHTPAALKLPTREVDNIIKQLNLNKVTDISAIPGFRLQ